MRSFADGNGDGIGDLAGVRVAAAVPARPRRRRALVQPLVPVAARRQRLRRRRLPRDRPRVRDARRGRGADRGRARRSASARSSTSSRTTSRTSTRGSATRSPPARARPSARASGSGAAAATTAAAAERLAVDLRRLGVDAGRQTASGTCTCSRRSSPTSTGRIPTSGRSTRTSCGSGSTAASPACGSTRPRCSSRTRASARSRRAGRPASTRTWTATSCTTSTAAGARSPTATPSRACSSARSGSPSRSGSPATCGPDELHTAFNFDFLACPWERGAASRVDRRRARRARAGRRAADVGDLEPRRHAAGHALRTRRHLVLVRGEAGRHADRPRRAAHAARGPPRCSRWRCRARCTSTRARSSGCPRSRTSRRTAAATRCGCAPAASIPGRDGCRVPIPWSGDRPPYGFSPRRRCTPWLDQPDDWAALTVEARERRPVVDAQASTARGLRLRRAAPWGEARRPALARRARRRARVRARRALRLPRQLRPRPVSRSRAAPRS